ncbi:RNase P/RNase MRP complex subunit [Yamadazyma tenuis]|uniref:Ribonuclease P protein subunit n=1 Tax=Candida tenuis (strain ATCC 10573 / BCRC 21748 / CBS 615 / JCM 9827 / NBRC 10315 / NRRL Y-1498 / VKM Y-70) TaxID=590646 RepID=G3B1N0_CANTC|nr:rRNA and tRNA processing [Yamadazyma tenuis ATCC 10573]EGV64488.1 rRNA and tRNA processing [Yamadazyma tenuis ATCC 10573]WEJ97249.1 RNase P/RNase MRP complex subunit [Yamadazyma tenuis]
MLEKNELERHLLSRCFSDREKIDELLETRYTFTGAQKPSLVLLPTKTEESKAKSLLHSEPTYIDEQLKKRKTNTRLEARTYLKTVKKNQDSLVRKIQEYNRLKLKTPKKPFPLSKLIVKFQIPTYEEFLPMNRLWNDYAQSLAFPEIKSPEDKLPNKQMILARLATAEYSGCLLTVLDSRNPNLLGLKGIVVYDTQYTFIICVERDEDEDATPAKQVGGFRFVPKKFTLFTFDLELPNQTEQDDKYLSFTLIGSRIDTRAVDRSTKKFKSHNVENIL